MSLFGIGRERKPRAARQERREPSSNALRILLESGKRHSEIREKILEILEDTGIRLVETEQDLNLVLENTAEGLVGDLRDRIRERLCCFDTKKGSRDAEKKAARQFAEIGFESHLVNFALTDNNGNSICLTLPNETPGVNLNVPGDGWLDFIKRSRDLTKACFNAMRYGGPQALVRTGRYALDVNKVYSRFLNKPEKPCAHIVLYCPSDVDSFGELVDAVTKLADEKNWRLLVEGVQDNNSDLAPNILDVYKERNFKFKDYHNLSKPMPSNYWACFLRESKVMHSE